MDAVKKFFFREWIEKEVLKDISFSVREGEILGYVGLNGAGKSTTLKILSGTLFPTSGTVEVNGIIPHLNRIKNAQNIAFIAGQRPSLLWDLPVRDSLLLAKRIYNVSNSEYEHRIRMFTKLLQLDEIIDQPVRQLSLGQRMRAGLTASLLHNPRIIYLDEPTIGVDVIVKENIRQFLREYNKETNATIMITSHDMRDIEDLCNRLIIINKGQIEFNGSLDLLRNQYTVYNKIITVQFQAEVDNLDLPGCEICKYDGKFHIYFNTNDYTIEQVLNWIQKLSYGIRDLNIGQPDLETVIKAMQRPSIKTQVG